MPLSIRQHLVRARRTLEGSGVPPADAALDADVLARHCLEWDLATLLTRATEPAPPGFAAAFAAAVARRTAREPVAYITGRREFWGRDFAVTRDVLVPRPETELIVEAALEATEPNAVGRILDVGTGSGCLAVTLLAERPGFTALATDVSAAALDVARANASRHGVADRLMPVRARGLDAIAGAFAVIVSNPPYVADGAPLPADVATYEPHQALFAGPDGLAVLVPLIARARALLAAGGVFVVEFGLGQAAAVKDAARAAAWTRVELRQDLQGIPRTAILR